MAAHTIPSGCGVARLLLRGCGVRNFPVQSRIRLSAQQAMHQLEFVGFARVLVPRRQRSKVGNTAGDALPIDLLPHRDDWNYLVVG